MSFKDDTFVRIFTKDGGNYVAHESEYDRIRSAVLHEPKVQWIELKCPENEMMGTMWLDAREIQAFWLSTPEDRELTKQFWKDSSEEDDEPWKR